jgi:hypothetical protein
MPVQLSCRLFKRHTSLSIPRLLSWIMEINAGEPCKTESRDQYIVPKRVSPIDWRPCGMWSLSRARSK